MPIISEAFANEMGVKLQVAGNSMYPLWKHQRDSVIVVSCDTKQLKKWDIVLYQRENGKFVLHRIVQSSPETFNMCGDAQFAIEKEINKNQIIGKVHSFMRNGNEISCNNLLYRLYVFSWYQLFPIRHAFCLAKKIITSKTK